MSWPLIADILAAACFIAGALLLLFTGIGMYRFPELLSRMHAATKPQVLGTVLMMGGLALSLRTATATWTLLLVVAFQIITAPVSAHMVARAGYRTNKIRDDLMVVDEYAEDLDDLRKRLSREAQQRDGHQGDGQQEEAQQGGGQHQDAQHQEAQRPPATPAGGSEAG